MGDNHRQPFDMGTDGLASGDAMRQAHDTEQGLQHVVDAERAWRRTQDVPGQPTHGDVIGLGTDDLATGDAMQHALHAEQELQHVVDAERAWRRGR
jgi:hypothetical protein